MKYYLDDKYIDSRYSSWHTGFSDFDLLVLPVYYTVVLAPVMILVVYRNKKARVLFVSMMFLNLLAFLIASVLFYAKQ